jgi:hypothetical protein
MIEQKTQDIRDKAPAYGAAKAQRVYLGLEKFGKIGS